MQDTPFVACIYGPPKVGKTSEAGYSFPRALFIAAPGALTPIETVCGYVPESTSVETISEATAVIKDAKKSGFETIVADEFSFIAEQTFSKLEKKFSGFKLWGELQDSILEFRNTARYSGVNVVLSCWEKGPKTDGKHVRGGPMLSGNLPEQIPALCDIVLRACHDAHRQPWPVVYRCYSDPSYVTGDRFNIANRCDPAPMNLGEILRAAGKVIPRRLEYPDQEDQVEKIANALSRAPDQTVLANQLYSGLVASTSPSYARWTLRDALDRAVIRKAIAAANDVFINQNGPLM